MLLARVEGKAISTIKHPSLSSWRMLIVQPLDIDGNAVDFPTLAIDSLGADAGEVVMITSDGKGARRLVNDPLSPVRWMVMGIVDHGVDVLRKNSSYYRR